VLRQMRRVGAQGRRDEFGEVTVLHGVFTGIHPSGPDGGGPA
jgi:hypothetical protein